jgi:phosphotransacetylase
MPSILDFFVENVKLSKINIREGLRHFIVVTSHSENQLSIRQYELIAKPFEIINAQTEIVSELDSELLNRRKWPKISAPLWI